MSMRPAEPSEAGLLSELALRSKGRWGYDEAFLARCRAELTLGAQDLTDLRVTVGMTGARVVGFYGIGGGPPTGELSHLFVEPDLVGHGHGRRLWEHAVDAARGLGMRQLMVEADPNAEPFYVAMGAERVGSAPSSSVGGRSLPLLRYRL